MEEETPETYFVPRNAQEIERLKAQHFFFVDLCKGILQPNIGPAESLKEIVDVGTGSGIWLDEVAKTLEESAPLERTFTGFDISPLMFPQVSKKGFKYIEHDARKPFPVSEQGRYDLVHLRFLAAAFKEDDIKVVVENVLSLLKPGGYLQWEDPSVESRFGPETGSIKMEHIRAMKLELFHHNNIMTNLPDAVMRELATHANIEILEKVGYHTLDRLDMKRRINEMYCEALTLVLRVVRESLPGYGDLDVEGVMGELMDEFEEKDLVFVDTFFVVTARKRVDGE